MQSPPVLAAANGTVTQNMPTNDGSAMSFDGVVVLVPVAAGMPDGPARAALSRRTCGRGGIALAVARRESANIY
eukprot:142744-Alexandrium_andersonii.AAC.1